MICSIRNVPVVQTLLQGCPEIGYCQFSNSRGSHFIVPLLGKATIEIVGELIVVPLGVTSDVGWLV